MIHWLALYASKNRQEAGLWARHRLVANQLRVLRPIGYSPLNLSNWSACRPATNRPYFDRRAHFAAEHCRRNEHERRRWRHLSALYSATRWAEGEEQRSRRRRRAEKVAPRRQRKKKRCGDGSKGFYTSSPLRPEVFVHCEVFIEDHNFWMLFRENLLEVII